jgi:TolB-like protein
VTVAVLDFDADLPDANGMGSLRADILTTRLAAEAGLTVVEREAIGKVLQEQNLALKALADGEQVAKVGKLLGAKLVVMSRAFVVDKKVNLVARVVGAETGRIAGCTAVADADKPFSDALGALTDEIAATVRKESATLLPPGAALPDPLEDVRKALAGAGRKAALEVC